MAVTYQDVVRSNGGIASWAFAEASGASLAPWLGGTALGVTGTIDYQQPGPFASSFSIGLHIGSKVGFAYPGAFSAPITWEEWVYFPTTPNSANQLIYYNGAVAANGAGLVLLRTSNHPQIWQFNGSFDVGQAITLNAWHLLQHVYYSGTSTALFIDGKYVATTSIAAPAAASPLQVNYGGDPANNANTAFRIAYPAIYPVAFSPTNAYASFLAATDPASAMAYTIGAASQGAVSNDQMLAAILAAVTYRGY